MAARVGALPGVQEGALRPSAPSPVSPLHRGSSMAVPRTRVSALSHSPGSLRLCPSGQRGLGDRRDGHRAAMPGQRLWGNG